MKSGGLAEPLIVLADCAWPATQELPDSVMRRASIATRSAERGVRGDHASRAHTARDCNVRVLKRAMDTAAKTCTPEIADRQELGVELTRAGATRRDSR